MGQATNTGRIMIKDPESRFSTSLSLLVAMMCIAAALQLYPFLSGYLLTADDVLFQYFAVTSPPLEWVATGWETARWKAKLGEFLSIPIMVAGNAEIGGLSVRVTNLVVFALSVGAFGVWLARRFDAGTALAFLIVAVALTPLRLFHMPPTSYPFFPSIQILILIVGLLGMEKSGSRGVVAFIVTALAMLSSEYTLLLGAALIVFTVLRDARSLRGAIMDLRLWALGIAGFGHILFRELSSGNYTEMSGGADIGAILSVMTFHTLNGISLGPAGFPVESDVLSAAGVARAILAGIATAGAALLAAPYLRTASAPTFSIMIFVALMVVAMTGPIALMEKYRDWCSTPRACAYIDSRYAGWAMMLGLVPGLLWVVLRAGMTLAAVILGLLSCLTALQNSVVAAEMRAYLEPWHAAERYVCAADQEWDLFLESELALSIAFHATKDRTRAQYWQAWATRFSCGD